MNASAVKLSFDRIVATPQRIAELVGLLTRPDGAAAVKVTIGLAVLMDEPWTNERLRQYLADSGVQL